MNDRHLLSSGISSTIMPVKLNGTSEIRQWRKSGNWFLYRYTFPHQKITSASDSTNRIQSGKIESFQVSPGSRISNKIWERVGGSGGSDDKLNWVVIGWQSNESAVFPTPRLNITKRKGRRRGEMGGGVLLHQANDGVDSSYLATPPTCADWYSGDNLQDQRDEKWGRLPFIFLGC